MNAIAVNTSGQGGNVALVIAIRHPDLVRKL